MLIAIVLPGGDLFDKRRLVGNPAIETLGCEHAEFGLRHVEPTAVLWRVMPFEPLDESRASAAGKAA